MTHRRRTIEKGSDQMTLNSGLRERRPYTVVFQGDVEERTYCESLWPHYGLSHYANTY